MENTHWDLRVHSPEVTNMLPVAHQGPTLSTSRAISPNPSRRTMWSSTPQPSACWPPPSSIALARYPRKHLRKPRPQTSTACYNLYYGILKGRGLPVPTRISCARSISVRPAQISYQVSTGFLVQPAVSQYLRSAVVSTRQPFAFSAQPFPTKTAYQHGLRAVATLGVVAFSRPLRL